MISTAVERDEVYGRDDEEWDLLGQAVHRILKELASRGRTTSHAEMHAVLRRRTGLLSFDFNLEKDRAAMGYLFGRIVDREEEHSGRADKSHVPRRPIIGVCNDQARLTLTFLSLRGRLKSCGT